MKLFTRTRTHTDPWTTMINSDIPTATMIKALSPQNLMIVIDVPHVDTRDAVAHLLVKQGLSPSDLL